jgi:ligand-binding SRPBCC domain-containing protein
MPAFKLETYIDASAEVCFDLVRDVRVHTQTTAQTGERAVAGVIDGMIGLGQTVTFEGRHFGMKQRLTVRVVEFERPTLFVDEMTEGTFKDFKHIHEFLPEGGGTLMRDTLIWRSPLGFAGRIVDKLFIGPHLRSLVTERNKRLKYLAEATAS